MGRRLENLEQFGIDVVLERRHGVRASILRGILYALSFAYDRLVQMRLYFYRKRIFRERALGVLVDKDRVKSGLLAIDKWKVDTLLLDDGLQYLHLKHRLDIVLVDRQAPFGNEFLLPRGTLREAPRNLRRASYIFITKSTGESNDVLVKRIRRYNRTAEIIECAHKPLYLQNVFTGEKVPLERLRDTFVGSISAIAAPESFEGALKKLGAHVDLAKRYIDHHYYTEAELISF